MRNFFVRKFLGHKDCAAGKLVGLMDCRLPFLIERFDAQDEKRRRGDLEASLTSYAPVYIPYQQRHRPVYGASDYSNGLYSRKISISIMKIEVLQKFKIIGDFTEDPSIDNFEFKISNADNNVFYVKLFAKTKRIETRCQKEISNDFYNLLKTGQYQGIQIFDETGERREDIDEKIQNALNNEFSILNSGFSEVTDRIIHYIKIWLSHTRIEDIESDRLLCSIEGENWIEIEKINVLTAIDLVIFSNLDEQNLKNVQTWLDNNIEPFVALDFLSKAQNESDPRYKWIYATIAAELAIKEFLIAKYPNLEVLLNELPSPPLDKLYGKILKEYEGIEPYMKIMDIQTGVKIRNHLVHRPRINIPITNQNAFIYIRLIEATIYQLLQRLYPQIESIVKDHYPPKIGYTELEKIPGF